MGRSYIHLAVQERTLIGNIGCSPWDVPQFSNRVRGNSGFPLKTPYLQIIQLKLAVSPQQPKINVSRKFLPLRENGLSQ